MKNLTTIAILLLTAACSKTEANPAATASTASGASTGNQVGSCTFTCGGADKVICKDGIAEADCNNAKASSVMDLPKCPGKITFSPSPCKK
jgi:hypothetical protein